MHPLSIEIKAVKQIIAMYEMLAACPIDIVWADVASVNSMRVIFHTEHGKWTRRFEVRYLELNRADIFWQRVSREICWFAQCQVDNSSPQ